MSTEAKDERITKTLSADDTSIVETKVNMNESVRRVKEVMNKWEER